MLGDLYGALKLLETSGLRIVLRTSYAPPAGADGAAADAAGAAAVAASTLDEGSDESGRVSGRGGGFGGVHEADDDHASGGGGGGGSGSGSGPPAVRLSRDADGELLLELWLPPARWVLLPSSLQGGGSVRLVLALISLGINAQQSVANAVGATKLQEVINVRSIQVLRKYHDAFRDLRLQPPPLKPPSPPDGTGVASDAADGAASAAPTLLAEAAMQTLLTELRRLDALMSATEAAVLQNALHTDKNVGVISLSETLVRGWRGGRLTSCKSGKDRTSMAVTAEQARLLHERHGVSEAESMALVDEVRARGVRWLNMRKNLKGGHYAFNWLNQLLLPQGYRAPKGTWGAGQT